MCLRSSVSTCRFSILSQSEEAVSVSPYQTELLLGDTNIVQSAEIGPLQGGRYSTAERERSRTYVHKLQAQTYTLCILEKKNSQLTCLRLKPVLQYMLFTLTGWGHSPVRLMLHRQSAAVETAPRQGNAPGYTHPWRDQARLACRQGNVSVRLHTWL